MEKTLFAGLTVLDQDESILTDGGAFIGRDRKIIDRLLEIGAKTHRHDGAPGLGNPLQGIGASATGSAGQLPGDLTFSVGYTLEDDQLGETLLSPLTTISTPPVLPRPAVAPTAVADYSTGDLLTDTYYYAISYTDGSGGETPIGPATPVEREPGFPDGRIVLSGLDDGMVAAGAVGWRLYRAVGGGDFHLLDDGTGDGYTDDGTTPVQPDMTPLTESENSTNSDNGILLHLPSADGRVAAASFINVYLSEDGSFSGNSFLDQFPVGSAGHDVFYPTVTLENAQPPDTNNSVGGASLIDPDTDLLDWHWKRPVQLISQLGSGTKGDVRLVHGASATYYLPNNGAGSADWRPLPTGSGGGGGGGGIAGITVADSNESYDDITEIQFTNSEIALLGGGAVSITASAGGGGGGAGLDFVFDTNQMVIVESLYASPADDPPYGILLLTDLFGTTVVDNDTDFIDITSDDGDIFTASALTAALITDTMDWTDPREVFGTLKCGTAPTGLIVKGFDDGAGGITALVCMIDSTNGLQFGLLDGNDPVADFTLIAGGIETYVAGDIYNLSVSCNIDRQVNGDLYAEVHIRVTTGFGDAFDGNDAYEGTTGPMTDNFGPTVAGAAGWLMDDDNSYGGVGANRFVHELTAPRLMLTAQEVGSPEDAVGFHYTYSEDWAEPLLTASFHYAAGGGGGGERVSFSFGTAAPIADDAREDGEMDTSGTGNGNSVMSILSVDPQGTPCRVLVYESAADQAADTARPFGTDPTGDHGVLLDVESADGSVVRCNPKVIAATQDGGQTYYVSLVNLSGGTTNIGVNFNAVVVAT